MSDYHGNGKLGFERNITILTKQVDRLERELKDARERNEVQNKYWHGIGVERNTLKEKYNELETELYFCNRNNKVREVVDG